MQRRTTTKKKNIVATCTPHLSHTGTNERKRFRKRNIAKMMKNEDILCEFHAFFLFLHAERRFSVLRFVLTALSE